MEHIVEFEAALESQEPRIWRSGPFKNQEIVRLSYRELSMYAQQVRRYFDIFGRENVHVILYDDFKNNPRAIAEGLLHFLGVDWNETDFRTVNANRRARSMSLQEFVRYPPRHLQKAARVMLPRRLRSALVGYLCKLNIVYESRPPMHQALRQRLQKEYEPEVEQLSELLDRNLSAWCRS
jgi:hypothetical protein